MFSMAGPVMKRPDLWVTALRQARLLAPRRWWRSAPFLPLPDGDYLRFRMVSMYGGDGRESDSGGAMEPRDVVAWLEWCRRWATATV
jgi:hypothetical protein